MWALGHARWAQMVLCGPQAVLYRSQGHAIWAQVVLYGLLVLLCEPRQCYLCPRRRYTRPGNVIFALDCAIRAPGGDIWAQAMLYGPWVVLYEPWAVLRGPR